MGHVGCASSGESHHLFAGPHTYLEHPISNSPPPSRRISTSSSTRNPKSCRGHGGSDRRVVSPITAARPPRLRKRQISYAGPCLCPPATTPTGNELTDGFQLMGDLQPSTKWYIRTDQKYLQPRSPAKFVDQVRAGRMNGPFKRPRAWSTPSVAPCGYDMTDMTLQPLPRQDPGIAMAFSIKQIGSEGKDKIRRGEDWRRSGHNFTCTMRDQPFHHTPDHFAASLAIQTHRLHPDEEMHVWGHDHDAAYRQLPLDNPENAYVLLHTPEGPTLWNHSVLLFGSSASLWGYNGGGGRVNLGLLRVRLESVLLVLLGHSHRRLRSHHGHRRARVQEHIEDRV